MKSVNTCNFWLVCSEELLVDEAPPPPPVLGDDITIADSVSMINEEDEAMEEHIENLDDVPIEDENIDEGAETEDNPKEEEGEKNDDDDQPEKAEDKEEDSPEDMIEQEMAAV